MAETFDVEALPRGTLLSPQGREARLEAALPLIRAATDGETDEVALFATLACLLWETMPQASWCGFYRRIAPSMLAVGPYQGPLGCLRIDFARGVCGAAARTRTTQRVPDVEAFPGHIACDGKTRSELVVPVLHGGVVQAVLDLDSHRLDAFSAGEARLLEQLLDETVSRAPLAFPSWDAG